MELLSSPIAQFIVLAILAAIGRVFLLRRGESATASGAIAMAIGIFVLGALQQLPFSVAGPTQVLTLGGLVVWAAIALSYVASYFRGTFHVHTDDPVGSFAIGTWVAGTAVLARLLAIVLPAWRPVALAMALLTLGVWIWYLGLIARRYRLILASPSRLNATGRILLATVSTQSVLLLVEQLSGGGVPRWLAAAWIALGYGLYGLGFVLIVQRYRRWAGWRLADGWDNTNCILHGALSITGLAAVDSGALPPALILATWVAAAGLLAIVEGIEVARVVARVRAYGWRRAVGTYHVSQWSRNFTFGMFYAFTLRLHGSPGAGAGGPLLDGLQAGVVAGGQYIVLALLLIEVGLFLWHNVEWRKFIPNVHPLLRGY